MSSKFGMPPGPSGRAPQGQQGQQQVKIDLSTATDVSCENCSNFTFTEVVLMKHLSAVASPTGEAVHVPFPTFACNACGFVNEAFLPPYMRKKQPEPTPTPKAHIDALGRTVTEAPPPEVTKIEIHS